MDVEYATVISTATTAIVAYSELHTVQAAHQLHSILLENTSG
jgi:hypothetical protein